MPILRLNAGSEGLRVHGSPACAQSALQTAARGLGPVIVMIHGFKYDPDYVPCSPHSTIFALNTRPDRTDDVLWPRHLGFGTGRADEGLALAFGWRARGNLWRAQRASKAAGLQLAEAIALIRKAAPRRPIHIVTHSMGSEVAFAALETLPAGSVQRIVALTGASYISRAKAALQSPAGQTCEFFNVMSRENDLFDFLYERLLAPPVPRDRAIGCGLSLENAVNIQIDSKSTLEALTAFGARIAGPARRICHWSGYTRPGALPFYARLMRMPQQTRLKDLQDALGARPQQRWSRLTVVARNEAPLPGLQKAAS